MTAASLRLEAADYGPRTKVGRLVRRKLPVADAYERGMQEARERSGVEAAKGERREAGFRVELAAREIGKAEALTMAGVVLKARALVASASTDGEGQRFCAGG